jgi:hypothetical protein
MDQHKLRSDRKVRDKFFYAFHASIAVHFASQPGGRLARMNMTTVKVVQGFAWTLSSPKGPTWCTRMHGDRLLSTTLESPSSPHGMHHATVCCRSSVSDIRVDLDIHSDCSEGWEDCDPTNKAGVNP